MKPRAPDFDFFSRYWRKDGRLRRHHRYHWFTRTCRSDLFDILEQRPSGLCVEIGPGEDSTVLGESSPTDIYLDIIPQLLSRGSGVIADAQLLPFRNGTLSALWGQTVCMHLSWNHVLGECFRCVKKGGIVAFLEPLRDNPIIRMFRRVDPSQRSEPFYLSLEGLEKLGERFGTPKVMTYFLFSPIVIPLTRSQNAISRSLQSMDAYLLEHHPHLHKYAWYASIYWIT